MFTKALMEEHVWWALRVCPVCNEKAHSRIRKNKNGRWSWVYRHRFPQEKKHCRSTVKATAPMKPRRTWKIKPVTKIVPDKRRKKIEKQERKEAK